MAACPLHIAEVKKKSEQDAAAGEIQSQAAALLASVRARKEAEARVAEGEPSSPLGLFTGIFTMRAEPREGATEINGDTSGTIAEFTTGVRSPPKPPTYE